MKTNLKKDMLIEVLTEQSEFRIASQNLEEEFMFFVQPEETEEERLDREVNQQAYRVAYADVSNMGEELNDELKALIAEQSMDDNDYVFKGSATPKQPVRIKIQKSYSMEVLNEKGDALEVKEGWFNLTAQDLGLGTTHKRVNSETEKEYRVAYYFEKDMDDVLFKTEDGQLDIDYTSILKDLDINMLYTAGDYTDLVFLDGVSYRVVVSHSYLSEVDAIGIDYTDDVYPVYKDIDGSGSIVGVAPKEKYAANTDKYKRNQEESNAEIAFGRANEVIANTTQLFYSEWRERRAEMAREVDDFREAKKEKVVIKASETRAKDDPMYLLISELNGLFRMDDLKGMFALALEHKEEAEEIMSYARRNKKHIRLVSEKGNFATPYGAVKKYIKKKASTGPRLADKISKEVASLVKAVKATGDKRLITEDNAKDVLAAARAGGVHRLDGEHKALYLHAQDMNRRRIVRAS